jgi:2-methylcitrate dehydratase PrpD
MTVEENPAFTRDYMDPTKRSIGNSVQVFFRDGTSTPKVTVEYPIGHRRRRAEGIPLLLKKFEAALRDRFPAPQADSILDLCSRPGDLETTPVDRFVDLFLPRAGK